MMLQSYCSVYMSITNKGINMNKTELINTIANATGDSKQVVARTVNEVIDTIGSELRMGHEVTLTGFGKFGTKQTAERQGRNPATGKAITIPAAIKPFCKMSKTLLIK